MPGERDLVVDFAKQMEMVEAGAHAFRQREPYVAIGFGPASAAAAETF